MNPYLEQDDAWHDFHKRFIPLAAELLGAQLLPRYIVKIEEYVFAHGFPGVDEEHLSFLAIRARDARRLVTTIELLSPAHKEPGASREQYLARRGRPPMGVINRVEIDFLRGGLPLPPIGRPACAYSVVVRRSEHPDALHFWPIGLREPLPRIPVPVRGPDSDAVLDLQAMLHRIYDGAGYADYVYDGSPHPPLNPEDAEWARSIAGIAG
jgi:hypothetical protein